MTTSRLRWVRREITRPAAVPSSADAPAPADVTVTFEFPDLSAWPTAALKVDLLLEKAAEVEHALMIQYLYAAYSLKPSTPPTTVTDPLQLADLRDWRQTIAGIAREEMGHLMTVQNLKLLLGFAPSFGREDFPMVRGLFPFESRLRPLDQETLGAYVVAESPTDAGGIGDIISKLGMAPTTTVVDHVGVLYGLIGVLLATDRAEIERDAAGGDFWYEMVGQLVDLAYRQDPDPKAWHLPEGAFATNSAARQGVQDDWAQGNRSIRIHSPKTRQDAKSAIQDIGLQGEGPGEATDPPSHFLRFLQMYRGHGTVRPFPDAGGWVPTLEVPGDPKVSDETTEPGAISHPTTQPWARLANLRYAMLLGVLEEYLSEDPATDPARRKFLAHTALQEMRVNLSQLSARLVTLPRAATGTGVAALPFEMPKAGFPLPNAPEERRQVIVGRLNDAIALAGQIVASQGGPVPILTNMMDTDRQTLTHFS